MGVRAARSSDVDAIADAQVRAWRDRFADLLPRPVLDALDQRAIAGQWATAVLEPPSSAHRVLVAVDGADVVGFAAIGPSPDPDAGPDVAELVALEVTPAARRRGHGSRLVAAAIDAARATGAGDVVIWYAVADEARRAFLVSAGWGPDGAFRDIAVGPDGHDPTTVVREVRLVTSLTSPPD